MSPSREVIADQTPTVILSYHLLSFLHSSHHYLNLSDLLIHPKTHTLTHRHKQMQTPWEQGSVSTQSGTWHIVSAQSTLWGRCRCEWRWLHGKVLQHTPPPPRPALHPEKKKPICSCLFCTPHFVACPPLPPRTQPCYWYYVYSNAKTSAEGPWKQTDLRAQKPHQWQVLDWVVAAETEEGADL